MTFVWIPGGPAVFSHGAVAPLRNVCWGSACSCRYLVECENWNDQDRRRNSESTQAAVLRTSAFYCTGNAWRVRFHFCSFTANYEAILFFHMSFGSALRIV